jgi:hypothetical protein
LVSKANVNGEAVGGRPEPSADLLRQLDDDPLRAADIAEPIAVFVALHLANELRAAGSQDELLGYASLWRTLGETTVPT